MIFQNTILSAMSVWHQYGIHKSGSQIILFACKKDNRPRFLSAPFLMIGIYARVDIQKVDQIILFASEKDNCPDFCQHLF